MPGKPKRVQPSRNRDLKKERAAECDGLSDVPAWLSVTFREQTRPETPSSQAWCQHG
jgi:hypothetical protein